jgi:hypothetical protein
MMIEGQILAVASTKEAQAPYVVVVGNSMTELRMNRQSYSERSDLGTPTPLSGLVAG